MLRSLVLFSALAPAALLAACSSNGEASTPPTEASSTSVPDPQSAGPALKSEISPAIVEVLRAGGLDPSRLPSIDDLHEPGHPRMRTLMEAFTMALGTTCDGCHVPGSETDAELRRMTPKKRIAQKMLDRFVRALEKNDGSAIFCDTCHQGQMKFLDRRDPDAVAAWMQGNVVDGLVRKDGREHGCATCHGEPFVGQFLDGWGR